MARPKKAGLDFYYRDVNELDDYRRIMLMEQYGPIGNTVFDIIADKIYRDGYYLEVPLKQLSVHIMRIIGGQWIDNIGQITDIIRYCGEIGLLSKELLAQSVITSEDFQRNYSYVSARRKANRSKYWLLPPEEEKDDASSEETGNQNAHNAIAPVCAAETPVIAAETPVTAAQTLMIAAETPVSAAQTPIHAAIIPQSREEQSRADTEQKRINEMMAEQAQSKAKQTQSQTKRKSADEIFLENEGECCFAAAAAAASHNHVKKADAAAADAAAAAADAAAAASRNHKNDEYAAAADAGNRESVTHSPDSWYKDTYEYAGTKEPEPRTADSWYKDTYEYAGSGFSEDDEYWDEEDDSCGGDGNWDIDSAFYAAVGRHLGQTDREQLEEVRREGADDALIAAVLMKVAARKGAREIHSFRYFLPAIRDKLTERKTAAGRT